MVAEEQTYMGKPVLVISNDDGFDRFPLYVGVTKCRKILQHLDEITKFVNTHAAVERINHDQV